jgi:hypothetical protein
MHALSKPKTRRMDWLHPLLRITVAEVAKEHNLCFML